MPAIIHRQTTNDDFLQHHGITDMHWGIRRYRNYDGTLTEAGKRRYYKRDSWGRPIGLTKAGERMVSREYKRSERSYKRNSKKAENEKVWKRNIKQGKDKPNTSAAEYITRQVGTIADEGIRTGKTIATEVENVRKQKRYKNNAEGKTDQELRDRISRIRLEREYNSLTNEDTSRGYETAMTILNVAGSVASVGLATVGIIATIKNLK